MIRFGVDWVTPKGPLGNGNPLELYTKPEDFPLGIEGDATGAFETNMLPEPHVLKLPMWFNRPLTPVYELLRDELPFIYEMVTYSDFHNSLGGHIAHQGSMFSNVSPEVKEAVRRHRAVIVINASTEGHWFIQDNLFARLYEQIRAERLPPGSIWLISGNLKVQDAHRRFVNHHRIPDVDHIRTYGALLFEDQMRVACRHDQAVKLTDFEATLGKPRPYRFLSLNRLARGHRRVLVSQFFRRGLADRAILSMSRFEDRINYPIDRYDFWCPGFPTIEDDIKELQKHLPLTVDTNDFESNHAYSHLTGEYLQSYFGVVTETLFEGGNQEMLFLSEKTFKPFANYHPFILAAMPYSLAKLREIGYKTFSPWFDERYDEIEDDNLRMVAILDEVERINGLPEESLIEMLIEMKPTLIHNRQRLENGPSSMEPLGHDMRMFCNVDVGY